MATKEPGTPRSQTSAPVERPSTTRDPRSLRDPDDRRTPSRGAGGDDPDVGGDRMPKGADEPGAGL
jgi:hypothetical protein